jgi:hypothetical protein
VSTPRCPDPAWRALVPEVVLSDLVPERKPKPRTQTSPLPGAGLPNVTAKWPSGLAKSIGRNATAQEAGSQTAGINRLTVPEGESAPLETTLCKDGTRPAVKRWLQASPRARLREHVDRVPAIDGVACLSGRFLRHNRESCV